MRRLGVWLLILLFPCAALAQPEHAPYDMSLSIRYAGATESQRALFDMLYDALWQQEAEVALPEDTPYREVTAVHELLVQEAPELCAVDTTWNIWYYERTPDKAHAVSLQYDVLPEARRELMVAAAALAETIDDAQGAYGRALALHDLVCDRVAYTPGAVNEHNAYGALAEGRAVCDGYAAAYALLMRLSGIPCSVISGEALEENGTWTAHSWNIAALGGQQLLFDLTWDDQRAGLIRWYFALPEKWMARDHRAETADVRASDTIAWSWHVMNGCFIPTGQGAQALSEAFRTLARTGQPVDLRFESAEDYQACTADLTAAWDTYNWQAAPGEQLYGTLTWRVSPAQQCLLIAPGT